MNFRYNKANNTAPFFFKKTRSFLVLLFICLSFSVFSKPKTEVFYRYTPEGYAQIQVQNKTTTELACWIAIDGYKKKFRLPPLSVSRWFTASSKHYDYTSFSSWCDYIELYPQYKNYPTGGSVIK